MPKLPALTSKQIIKKFGKLGFVKDHQTGSHLILYNAETKRRAVIPYHTKDLPKGTLSAILRESQISREELLKK